MYNKIIGKMYLHTIRTSVLGIFIMNAVDTPAVPFVRVSTKTTNCLKI